MPGRWWLANIKQTFLKFLTIQNKNLINHNQRVPEEEMGSGSHSTNHLKFENGSVSTINLKTGYIIEKSD